MFACLVALATGLPPAIETTIDMISEGFHPLAKIAKDIASGVVLVASIGALILAYLILYPAFKQTAAQGFWKLRTAPPDVLAFVSLAIVIILVIILKALIGKGEPLRGGMPSGHAGVACSVATSVAFAAPALPVLALAWLLALLVAQSRVLLGVHTFSEVLAGGLLGTGVTLAIHLLFR